MHCSNFSGRSYVERTPEQCNLNYHRVQKVREIAWWDKHYNEGFDE